MPERLQHTRSFIIYSYEKSTILQYSIRVFRSSVVSLFDFIRFYISRADCSMASLIFREVFLEILVTLFFSN